LGALLNVALIALAVVCASLSVKPSSNTSAAATPPKGTPIYGAIHIAVPPGEKTFPTELMPEP